MKKIIYILLLAITGVFTSCELDRAPFTEIAADELFKDPGAAQTATLGNYLFLKGDKGYDGWSDDLHRMSEYAGDNAMISGGTTDHLFFFYNYKRIPNNGRNNRFWSNSFKAIVGTNRVVESLTEGKSDEEDQVIGENYYIRALVFFQMGNVFGKPYNQGTDNLSIPLKLTSDITDLPDRNTVGEVYDQVISDLMKAEALMNENKSASFATKEAAQALLSRVYLYMGDNAKAIEYADKVINSGRYSLLPSNRFAVMNTLAPAENEEAIFSITLTKGIDLPTNNDHKNTIGSFYAMVDGVGWGEMYASQTYLDLVNQNTGDLRKSFIEAQYLKDEDTSQKIPAVYWVDESNYTYVFERTKEDGGVVTFTHDGNTYTLQSEETNERTLYYFNGPNGRQDVTFDFDIDKRNGYPKFYILKASKQENDLHLWSPTVSRLAEMYLNKAEALAKQGAVQEALDNINTIRTRAKVPAYTMGTLPTGKTVLDVVLDERRLELAFEGHRKFDVYRNGRTMNRRYPGTHLDGDDPFYEIKATDKEIIEFIPEQQILIQPSLKQND